MALMRASGTIELGHGNQAHGPCPKWPRVSQRKMSHYIIKLVIHSDYNDFTNFELGSSYFGRIYPPADLTP